LINNIKLEGTKLNSKLKEYALKHFFTVARDLVENPSALKFKLNNVIKKANKKAIMESLGSRLADIKTLVRLIQSWLNKDYTDVSKQTIVYSVMALVYFFTPTDFVPDFLLGLGYIDDIAVISWVLNKIQSDLEKFRTWESKKSESN
jgi:uncharacterized membrane protein YkvA (DUF1232 family)